VDGSATLQQEGTGTSKDEVFSMGHGSTESRGMGSAPKHANGSPEAASKAQDCCRLTREACVSKRKKLGTAIATETHSRLKMRESEEKHSVHATQEA
jgi:hypothetical protein